MNRERPTKFEREHYDKLVGKTIQRVQWEVDECGDAFPIIVFTDGHYAVVYQDPEGNGPGWLSIDKA